MSVVQNNTISTNSITEATSANGVSIDGLKVKDYSLMYGSNIGLTVDSNGYVLKPNVPAISVTMDANAAIVNSKNIFDTSSYSGSPGLATTYTGISQGITLSGTVSAPTGTFTVPVAGVYSISLICLGGNAATSEINFVINGAIEFTAQTGPDNNWNSMYGHILWDMGASDTIYFQQVQTSTSDAHIHMNRYARASIHLIG